MSQPTSIGRILRRPVADSESVESSALVVGAAVFVIGFIVGGIVFWGNYLPIAGPGSLGQFLALGGAIASFVTFIGGRMLVARSGGGAMSTTQLHWWDVAAIGLAHAVISLLGWLGVASLLEMSFQGAVVFAFSAAVLAGVGIGLTAYVTFISSVSLTPMLLSLVLAVFLVVGAFASMLSASDPLWWKLNLSSLGMTDDVSARAFNLTLIIAGVMVTTIAHFATANIPTTTPREIRGRRFLRIALVLIGIFLACVGIFPVDEYLEIHNTVASGMVAIYLIMVIALRWWVPGMPRVFLLLGYVYLGVIVVLAVFFLTGYYNLTAVELVAAVLIFSWIIVFLRSTGSLGALPAPAVPPVANSRAGAVG